VGIQPSRRFDQYVLGDAGKVTPNHDNRHGYSRIYANTEIPAVPDPFSLGAGLLRPETSGTLKNNRRALRRSALSADATTFTLGPTPNTVRSADGKILTAPEGWILLPPGDAALTRRVKAAGDHWVVQEKKGRKVFSRGVWAPAATVERIRSDLDAERVTETAKELLNRTEGEGPLQGRDPRYGTAFYGRVVEFVEDTFIYSHQ
jgi:hypothetical protein